MNPPEFRSTGGRDLYWALTSPGLLRHSLVVPDRWGQRELEHYGGLFRKLDHEDSVLNKALRRSATTRLGERFEILINTWIQEVPPARFLAANWQVFGGQGTVGEFDLLFERDRQIWHWELAIKFYLGHPHFRRPRWYGPDPRDRLGLKWSKMKEKQLRLGENEDAQKALRSLHIQGTPKPRAFLKGYLFEALNQNYQVPLPKEANPQGLRGFWVHQKDWLSLKNLLEPHQELRWATLHKERWMAPFVSREELHGVSSDALLARIPAEISTMVVGFTKEEQGLQEFTRGFIVPDRWPDLQNA